MFYIYVHITARMSAYLLVMDDAFPLQMLRLNRSYWHLFMHRSCNKMKDWPTPSLPYKNNRKKKQQMLQTNTQQPGKMKSFGKTLSSSATVLPTLMGNHFAQFLQISFALWERWQCFSSSLQTRKNWSNIHNCQLQRNFSMATIPQKLELQNLPISNSKGGH